MRFHRNVRRDANHKAIVDALLGIGASVVDLAAVGGGVSDLLVGYRRRNKLLEVKNPAARAGKKRGARQAAIDARQAKFRESWRGECCVVNSVDEAIGAVTT